MSYAFKADSEEFREMVRMRVEAAHLSGEDDLEGAFWWKVASEQFFEMVSDVHPKTAAEVHEYLYEAPLRKKPIEMVDDLDKAAEVVREVIQEIKQP